MDRLTRSPRKASPAALLCAAAAALGARADSVQLNSASFEVGWNPSLGPPSPSAALYSASFEVSGSTQSLQPPSPSAALYSASFETDSETQALGPASPSAALYSATFEQAPLSAPPPPSPSVALYSASFEIDQELQSLEPATPSVALYSVTFEASTSVLPNFTSRNVSFTPDSLALGDSIAFSAEILNTAEALKAGAPLDFSFRTAGGAVLATGTTTAGLPKGTPSAPSVLGVTASAAAAVCTEGPERVVFTPNASGTVAEETFDDDASTSSATVSIACSAGAPICVKGACKKADGMHCAASDECASTHCSGASVCCSAASEVPPTLASTPQDIVTDTTAAASVAVVFAPPAATSVDGAPLAVTCLPASGSLFAIGTTTVVCTSAADQCGGAASTSFHVTVQDHKPPALALPAELHEEATDPFGTGVGYVATAHDTSGHTLPVSCAPPTGSEFSLGTTWVTCSATNAFRLTSTGSFPVIVQDTTSPALVGVPNSQALEATSPAGAVGVWNLPVALDRVDGLVPVTCDFLSGTTFPIGVTQVTCGATDSRGNAAHGSFSITVRATRAPALTLPADLFVEATGPAGAQVAYAASAFDVLDGSVPVHCAPPSGGVFALGATAVACTASDARGNLASGGFQVTVRDTTPPLLSSVPANISSVEATSARGASVSFAAPGAVDLVDGAITAVCSPAPGSTFAIGITAVRCTATDKHGNAAAASFSVQVQATQPPVLQLPAGLHADATGPAGAAVAYAASATDIVDGTLAALCSPASGATFAVGVTHVLCHATNSRGLTASGSFDVTVDSPTPPTLTLPAPIVAEAASAAGAVVTYAATASDSIDGALTATCAPASGATFALGVTTVNCSAINARGRTASGSFTITVRDTTPPTLSNVPQNIVAEASGPAGAAVSWAAPGAVDRVDGPVAVTCAPASGTAFALDATTTVTCSASDAHHNQASQTFTVTVRDRTPPALSNVPQNLVAEATGPAGAAVSWAAPGAVDLVDGPVAVSCAPASGATFALDATTAVTCTASDARHNPASQTFTVRVRDTTPPRVTVPAPITVAATSGAGAVVTFAASALDLVDGAIAPVCSPASGATFPPGTTQVTCAATDRHGNRGAASFPVSVGFGWGHWKRPLDPDGDSSRTFSARCAIPVRFELNEQSERIHDLVALAQIARVSDRGVVGPWQAAPSAWRTGGNRFRWQAERYSFRLATRDLAAGRWLVRADLGDGALHTAPFRLTTGRGDDDDCESDEWSFLDLDHRDR